MKLSCETPPLVVGLGIIIRVFCLEPVYAFCYTERAFLDAPESAAEHAGESEFRSSVPHSAFFILPITADSPAAGLLAESPASTGRVTMLIVTAASLRLYRP